MATSAPIPHVGQFGGQWKNRLIQPGFYLEG
jgi:hypothetical protein